jgi:hypothetical protein
MHLPTRIHILVTALRVRVISPSHNVAATPVLSYQLRVLRYPERYAKTEALGGRGSGLPSAIKLENILDYQAKYGKQQEDAGALPCSDLSLLSKNAGPRFGG